MDVWTTTPPNDRSNLALRVVRTPPGRALQAIITCPGITGRETHFVNNRTQPCAGDGKCEYCEAGHSRRWHGYVSCVLTKTMEHVIFEMTGLASETFTQYYRLHDTLIGCHFSARRTNGRHNGRVFISCKAIDLGKTVIPPMVNVQRILSHIWGIPYVGLEKLGRTRPTIDRVGVVPAKNNGRNQTQEVDAKL